MLRSAQHRTSEMSRGAMGCSEDIGQCLPLAGSLRHHLLQMQGLAQVLGALLLGGRGFLQGSCRADRAQVDQIPEAEISQLKDSWNRDKDFLLVNGGLSTPMRRAI